MANLKELNVNSRKHSVQADAECSLLSVLREELDLTGSKFGCGEGQCGACTVLINGQATRSCSTPLSDALGKQVTTIEGLERRGQLHPLQQAFLDQGAMQCGYCTAGMIMSGVALLNQHTQPTDQEIIEAMAGNICRCGTYPRIVAAIRQAAQPKRGGAK